MGMMDFRVSDFIGSTLFIDIDEDRSLQGTLVAVDCQMNLLLDHVHEYTKTIGSRRLGLVSVPQPTIKSIRISQAKMRAITDFKRQFQQNIV
ncbi:N-alpha-acetyltransferase 38, NatC auxiliary subunit [Nakaseomyces bracarensis]|uniref:N-alpha-acetyltransferase 38, NatC auxiliary subunit n=1 Tax=Nakaseomyces bracarensis TaxID=273131 RepID=A0ABR4NYP3_9SACH